MPKEAYMHAQSECNIEDIGKHGTVAETLHKLIQRNIARRNVETDIENTPKI